MRINLKSRAILMACLLSIGSCISVPKEASQLSQLIGQDLTSIHQSYINLVRTHFNTLRELSKNYLDHVWTPTFLKEFIETGKLVERASGDDPKLVLDKVHGWTIVAQEFIDEKRKELLDPINKDEENLINDIDSAFYNLIAANTSLTAYLKSNEKLKKVQDELLDQAGLKKLRDSINKQLIEASKKSQKALDELEKINKTLIEINNK